MNKEDPLIDPIDSWCILSSRLEDNPIVDGKFIILNPLIDTFYDNTLTKCPLEGSRKNPFILIEHIHGDRSYYIGFSPEHPKKLLGKCLQCGKKPPRIHGEHSQEISGAAREIESSRGGGCQERSAESHDEIIQILRPAGAAHEKNGSG